MLTRSARVLLALCLAVVLASACQGPQGPQGAAGPKGDPGDQGPGFEGAQSISTVSPGLVLTGRSAQVRLSGFATTWADGVTVDLGGGITIDKLTVASPTALIGDITVAENAAVGTRDVSVTQDGATLTFKGGFEVSRPVALNVAQSIPQGGIARFTLKNLDPTNLFTPDPPGAISGTSDVGELDVIGIDAYDASGLIFTDVSATAGAHDVTFKSGLPGAEVTFALPGALNITERAPTPLVEGTPADVTFGPAFDTAVFSYTSTQDALVTASIQSMGHPNAILSARPQSGKISEELARDSSVTLLATPNQAFTFVAADLSGAHDYMAQVTLTTTPLAVVSEKEPNDSAMLAQKIATLPATVSDGTQHVLEDADWYQIDVTAADAGKVLHARTSATPADASDPVITIYAADGTTVVAQSDDIDYQESIRTPALTAGTYYVVVTVSTYQQSANDDPYALILTFE